MRPVPGYRGPLPGPNIDIRYFDTFSGDPIGAIGGGNNGGGLASTVNSLPPQIESLSSALQNINKLANQLTGGIASLMSSLQGNENASGLGNVMPNKPIINHLGLGGGLQPYRPNQPAYYQGGIGALGQNPLQLGRLV